MLADIITQDGIVTDMWFLAAKPLRRDPTGPLTLLLGYA